MKKSICNLHSELEDLIDDILELKILSEDKMYLIHILGKMRALLKEAMEAGQRMEDRLSAYRLMIEDLGFIRDKDHKLKDELANLKEKIFELENLPTEECNTCQYGSEGTCNNCRGVEGVTTEISGKGKCDNYEVRHE
jgi:hypothetical protein